MKDFFIHQAIAMILSLLVGLDKDGSEVKKFQPYLTELRDDLLLVYPLDKTPAK